MSQTIIQYNYAAPLDIAAVGDFVDELRSQSTREQGGSQVFDSAASADFIGQATSRAADDLGVEMPEKLAILLDELKPAERTRFVGAFLDGVETYEQEHGCNPPPDLLGQAIHNAYATSRDAASKSRELRLILDSATSAHSDTLSLQTNRAIVATLPLWSDVPPFVMFLPADIGSNEAKLAIMSHTAGSTFGRYAENASLNGVSGGDAYLTSRRIHQCAVHATDGTFSGKLTPVQSDEDTCSSGAGDLKLLRGRCQVYIGGKVVAKESSATGSGNSTITGSVTISGTTYTISGTINTDTGVIAGTTSPAIPNTTVIYVEGFIDWERNTAIIPAVNVSAEPFTFYAYPYRAKSRLTIDAATQLQQELRLDPLGESARAIQQQYTMERYYEALQLAKWGSANNAVSLDFDWDTLGVQKARQTLWQESLLPTLFERSQVMAEATQNYGIKYLYVDKFLASQFAGLDSSVFEPSGISARPSVYRLGRLFGQFEVYYTPRFIASSSTASQLLAIGRATDVTRNPVIWGDAVPPMLRQLPSTDDLQDGNAFYARVFGSLNPHSLSSNGFSLVDITSIK